MGMYTELIFGARLKESLPQDVINILKFMVEAPFESRTQGLEIAPTLPNHPFFKTDRWQSLFHMGSYYFGVNFGAATFTKDSQGEYILSSRSNLKNYTQEIELFLDWIKPYIVSGSGTRDFYAIVCYEEQAEPTIYYLKDKDETQD